MVDLTAVMPGSGAAATKLPFLLVVCSKQPSDASAAALLAQDQWQPEIEAIRLATLLPLKKAYQFSLFRIMIRLLVAILRFRKQHSPIIID